MRHLLHVLSLSCALLWGTACCFTGVARHTETSGDAAAATPEASWPPMPDPGPLAPFTPPSGQGFTLSNGLPVTFVQAGEVPLFELRLNVYTGSGDDPPGRAGLADFTADMLNEGTATRSALELSDALQTLATDVSFGSATDFSYGRMESLEDTLDESLELFSDMLQHPSFPEADLTRVRSDRRNRLITRADQLSDVAFDVFLARLYGATYVGRNREGTVEDLDATSRDDIVGWYRGAWRPSNAGLVVVTRLAPEAVLPLLEEHLGTWKDTVIDPIIPVPAAPAPQVGRTIYWVDRPGSAQSFIIVGNTAPGFDPDVQTARTLGNFPFGGQFTSRINMNLREDKGFTYGARSRLLVWARGSAFGTWASVKTGTTAASMHEFLSELDDFLGDRPATEEEFERSKSSLLQGFVGRFEGMSAVLGQIGTADANHRPEGWLTGYSARVGAVTREAAQAAIRAVVSPADLAIVVVGDWSAVGADVTALGLGDVVFLDDHGEPTDAPTPPVEEPTP